MLTAIYRCSRCKEESLIEVNTMFSKYKVFEPSDLAPVSDPVMAMRQTVKDVPTHGIHHCSTNGVGYARYGISQLAGFDLDPREKEKESGTDTCEFGEKDKTVHEEKYTHFCKTCNRPSFPGLEGLCRRSKLVGGEELREACNGELTEIKGAQFEKDDEE